MSDLSDRPSETLSDHDSNGLKTSDEHDTGLHFIDNHDVSSFSNRAGIAIANGLPLEDADLDEDDEEEVDEDYVAVDHDDINEFPYWFRRPPVHHRTKLEELHPFVQVLTESNVDDCVNVESAFPEQERCSREKVC